MMNIQTQLNQLIKKVDDLEGRLEKINLENKEIFSHDEAAYYLGLAPSTLYDYKKRRIIPYYRPTERRTYFLKEDLKKYALKNRIASIDEQYKEAMKKTPKGRFFKR